MNEFGLEFHHMGLATASELQAVAFLSGLGYQVPQIIYDPLQRVNLRMCQHHHQPDIELVTQADASGPLDAILSKNNAMVYHLCYFSTNVRNSLDIIKERGHRILTVSEPKPAKLFENKLVSFYMIRGIGLVEIIDGSTD